MSNEPESIVLGKRSVSVGGRPYIIAEIGVNHEGSMAQAKQLIDLAKEGGADAAKFQTYKANRLAARNSPAYWDTTKETTTSQYKLFQKYDAFDADDYEVLADYCERVEIDFLSTPFDSEAVEFLNPRIPFFKVASADITNVPLLRQIGEKGKPVVLSTGASTKAEIDFALGTLEQVGSNKNILMHCVLNYPTPNKLAHLRMIEGMQSTYPNHLVGYSDHTLPDDCMLSLIVAYLKGSVVLEKHFTHDKTLPGNDHYHAMDVSDLRRLVASIQEIEVLVGTLSEKCPVEGEEISRHNARRSIVLAKSIKAGARLREKDLTCKRPAHGVCPSNWDSVIGTVAARDLLEDHILQWDDLEMEIRKGET